MLCAVSYNLLRLFVVVVVVVVTALFPAGDLTKKFRDWCKNHGLSRPPGILTPANTGILDADYAELGSTFKASTVKIMLVFLTATLIEHGTTDFQLR
jgi:hypothetical protein